MDATVELLHRVSRATVTIAAEVPQSHPSVAVLGANRFGSGTVIDETGLVLTVNYVVVGASSIGVIDVEGRRHEGAVVAQDFASGVAVIRAEAAGLEIAPVPAGDSRSLTPGEDVFMVASLGSEERRTTTGTVTAVDPFDAYWEYRIDRALWATCSNPGLGGGPLCDHHGRLVGVVSLNLGMIGRATLAIPAEYYFEHAAELLASGRRTSRPRRAWLGMFCHAFPDRTVIAGVIPGSPGEKCGLKAGDIILRVAGETIRARPQLYDRIWHFHPGDVVELQVYRDGARATVAVQSGDADEFFS